MSVSAYLLKRHREAEAAGESGPAQAAREQQLDTLRQATRKVRAWLKANADQVGASGKVKKSNITDNESAKMKTSNGVIQGYDGVAVTATLSFSRFTVHRPQVVSFRERGFSTHSLARIDREWRALANCCEARHSEPFSSPRWQS